MSRWHLYGLGVLLAVLLGACGGEVTAIDFGQEEEQGFETYSAEIQPILQLDGPGLRNCSNLGGCHATGIGDFTFFADPDEAQLVENYQQVVLQINREDPDASMLLFAPLVGGRGGHPPCFPNTEDCCYQKIRAWIADEESPDCACPPEE